MLHIYQVLFQNQYKIRGTPKICHGTLLCRCTQFENHCVTWRSICFIQYAKSWSWITEVTSVLGLQFNMSIRSITRTRTRFWLVWTQNLWNKFRSKIVLKKFLILYIAIRIQTLIRRFIHRLKQTEVNARCSSCVNRNNFVSRKLHGEVASLLIAIHGFVQNHFRTIHIIVLCVWNATEYQTRNRL